MFTAAVVPNDLDHARIGITVSRRAAPRATARNRLKRIAREAFRARQNRLPTADIVLIAAPAASAAGSAGLRRDLDQLMDRIARDLESAHPGR
jgi:ribonuclease P protein component